jgi:myo-inositol-1(or 4)-monophosphatase
VEGDETRVTFADFAISENILTELRRSFPDDDFLSEEGNPADEVLPLRARFAWLLDPIDGTNNYALGMPACAISLALLRDGEPLYGFVYDLGREGWSRAGPASACSTTGALCPHGRARSAGSRSGPWIPLARGRGARAPAALRNAAHPLHRQRRPQPDLHRARPHRRLHRLPLQVLGHRRLPRFIKAVDCPITTSTGPSSR